MLIGDFLMAKKIVSEPTYSHCLAIVSFFIASELAGCSTVGASLQQGEYEFAGEMIRGRVLDKDSNNPIPKVAVVARWEIGTSTGAMEGGKIPLAYIHLAEAITDSEGRYEIPAWGPVRYRIPDEYYEWYVRDRSLVASLVFGSDLRVRFLEDACLFVFVPGYTPSRYCNKFSGEESPAKYRSSIWNDKILYLRRTHESEDAQWGSMTAASVYAYEMTNHSTKKIDGKPFCGYERAPQFISYALSEENSFYSTRAKHHSRILLVDKLKAVNTADNKQECRSMDAFIASVLGAQAK